MSMKLKLRTKTNTAIEALREIHSDTTGPASDNLEAIQEVIEEALDIKQALESDVKAAATTSGQ